MLRVSLKITIGGVKISIRDYKKNRILLSYIRVESIADSKHLLQGPGLFNRVVRVSDVVE